MILGAPDATLECEESELLDCLVVTEGPMFCQFTGRAAFGGETLAPAFAFANALEGLLGARWASFDIRNSA